MYKVDLAVLGMRQYLSWEWATTPSCVHVSYIAGGFSEPWSSTKACYRSQHWRPSL